MAEKFIPNGTIEHSGIKGMRWGVRRYQREDGTLTEEGKKRYLKGYNDSIEKALSIQNKINNLDKNDFKDKNGDFNEEAYNKALKNLQNEKSLEEGKTKTIDENQSTYFDQKKWDDETVKGDAAKVQALKEAKTMFDQAGDLAGRSPKGSVRINNKEKFYKSIPDEEMRRRINRLQMERQYGDLTGDNKYVLSGKEKAKEILQTVGSVLGIAASALTVGLLFKQFGHRKPGQGAPSA